jgi:hypothetical protein
MGLLRRAAAAGNDHGQHQHDVQTSPANNSTVTSPVNFAATATHLFKGVAS